MLDLMKLKWRELLIFFSNKKHAHLFEKELKSAIVHYLAFEDLGLAITLNEYIEEIKINSFYIAIGVAVGIVGVTLICLAPPVAAYLLTAVMAFGFLSMNLRYFVEISDNLYN